MTRPPATRALASRAALAAVALFCAGCGLDNPDVSPPAVDEQYFRCAVEPVLVRECSSPACHGYSERRLHILAPGRMRLAGEYAKARQLITVEDVDEGIQPPLTGNEERFNFLQARGFARGPVDESQLLSRPLAVAAGGTVHVARLGGDVFETTGDPGYLAIRAWLNGADVRDCPLEFE
ncbi:MAG: hypothetical protein H6744_13645 [Deltaproteobacteria bacterium]|nr:hypothetical protein [Deltaproteobacteria bacterium]